MNHADIFSGVGGFSIASSWMGWHTEFQVEIDPFCQKVLKHHFPSTTLYGDIRTIDFTKYRGTIDILTAGTPCQPASAAGKRRGTDDNRWLWGETFRAMREIRPTWCIFENVKGLTSLEQGVVFDKLLTEMEDAEYEVQTFNIPACAVNAPHRRERIWFVANRRSSEPRRVSSGKREEISPTRGADKTSADARCERRQQGADENMGSKSKESKRTNPRNGHWSRESWLQAATRLCRVDDGLPRELDGITVPKWRKESLKSYGNAIVPQIAYQIFQSIPV